MLFPSLHQLTSTHRETNLLWPLLKAGEPWCGHWAVNASCLSFLLPGASCPCLPLGQHTRWRWDSECTAWCHKWPVLLSPHHLKKRQNESCLCMNLLIYLNTLHSTETLIMSGIKFHLWDSDHKVFGLCDTNNTRSSAAALICPYLEYTEVGVLCFSSSFITIKAIYAHFKKWITLKKTNK